MQSLFQQYTMLFELNTVMYKALHPYTAISFQRIPYGKPHPSAAEHGSLLTSLLK